MIFSDTSDLGSDTWKTQMEMPGNYSLTLESSFQLLFYSQKKMSNLKKDYKVNLLPHLGYLKYVTCVIGTRHTFLALPTNTPVHQMKADWRVRH